MYRSIGPCWGFWNGPLLECRHETGSIKQKFAVSPWTGLHRYFCLDTVP